ncbi:MAG: sulfotransferase family protein [Acidimicrobiales bacterium]
MTPQLRQYVPARSGSPSGGAASRVFHHDSGGDPHRVDVMIIGAQKAGTSALLRYLGMHPRVRPQVVPEMTWFVDPLLQRRSFPASGARYFGGEPRDDRLSLGKLAGLMYAPEALDRLYEVNPDVHVLVILREPVARAHSAFGHARARGREPLESFEEALVGEPARFADDTSRRVCEYVERSRYANHLPAVFDRFGRGRVHVLFLEEFLADPRSVLTDALAPLGLDADDLPVALEQENGARRARWPGLARVRWNPFLRTVLRLIPSGSRMRLRRRYVSLNERPQRRPPLDADTERRLRVEFADANRELARLLGRELPPAWG